MSQWVRVFDGFAEKPDLICSTRKAIHNHFNTQSRISDTNTLF